MWIRHKPTQPLLLFFIVTLMAALGAAMSQTRGTAQTRSIPYATVFYQSGSFKIEAYLYTPTGAGPFPLVIYNHGSRAGQERLEQPFPYIGRLLTDAGYAVLVPERRGYGKSDGLIFADDVGTDRGPKFIARLQAETDDVLAALSYAKALPGIDMQHVAIMGWSFGGIITVFGASRSPAFVAVVNQATGALNWDRSPDLRKALVDAAGRIKMPILSQSAENDATTSNSKSIHAAAKAHGATADLIIYPPFTPSQNPGNTAPGHLLFSAQGVSIWGKDVVAFLGRHLR